MYSEINTAVADSSDENADDGSITDDRDGILSKEKSLSFVTSAA